METETNLRKGYEDALRRALSDLAEKEPSRVCLNAGVSFEEASGEYRVEYLGAEYCINIRTGDVGQTLPALAVTSKMEPVQEVSVTVKILLLHYLIHASGKPLSGNLVSFRELKNGAGIYYPTFLKRAVTPMVNAFGDCPESLYGSAEKRNGTRERFGHASVTIRVLPMIPVTYVIWQGEEDIPSSGTILFDSSIEYYLPAEDIVVAGSFGAYELIRLKKEEGNGL